MTTHHAPPTSAPEARRPTDGVLVHVAIDLDTASMRLVERRLGEAGMEAAFLQKAADLHEHLPLAHYLLIGEAPRIDWSRARSLELLQASEGGLDPLFPAEGLEPRVQIAGIGDAHADIARDHAMCCLLAFTRDLPRALGGKHAKPTRPFPSPALAGQRLVVVGLGTVGSRVAATAQAFGMDVVGVRRQSEALATVPVVPLERLPELLTEANHVVVTLPSTPSTRGLFDARLLECLPFRSVLVSVSRGGVIDLAAVAALLAQGRLKAAAIDLPTRAIPSETSSLWSTAGLFLTDLSSSIPNRLDAVLDRFVENVNRVRQGLPPLKPISREFEY